MKKIILLMTLVAVVQAGVAQQTVHRLPPENRFNEGKALFLEGDYAAAHEMLADFLDRSDDAALREEAEYMMAACGFYRGEEHGGERLMAFLKEHPESVHRNEGAFLVASYFFDRKEWQTAKEWFDRCSIDYLTPSEQEEYGFRRAYTLLQMEMKDEAERWFESLYRNSRKYGDAADYYLGYIAYSRGEYGAALERFDRLKNHPMYGEEASFYEAQAVFFDGKLEEAVRLAEAFVEAYPQSGHLGEMYRILGNANYRLGYANRALTYYEKYMATTDKPLRGDAYFMGLAYIDAGKYADAIRMLQLAVGPQDALTQNAQLQLGQLYLRQGDKQQAQFAFEAASREDFDPKVTETALYNYALLVHETNMSVFGESIALFEKFLRMYPDSPYAEKVNDILAETFLSAKDYEAALEAINRIANPGRRILEAKQMVLFQLGAQQFINGDLNEAIRLFTSCIGMGNYDAEARNSAYFWRGESYYRMGNYRNAEADFKAFVDNARPTDKNYALGWYSLGYAQFNQNRYAEAMRSFQQYLSAETNKNRPEYADALNRLGDIYYYNRNFAEAERRYAQAAEVNPQTADYAAFQKAFVMGLQRNYEGKIRELDELMRRYPNSIYYDDALYEKSRALTMLGRETEAIKVLEELIAKFPDSPLTSQAGIQLGQLYYNTGNYPKSVAAYKRVIEKFPGSEDARNALISLETVYRDMNDIESYINYANSLPGGLRIAPSRQDSLTFLAAERVYMKGSRDEARQALIRYLQSYPDGAFGSDANYYLGVIADEKGNKDEALGYFRKVIDAGNSEFMENALLYAAQAEYEKGNYRQALADYAKLANTSRNAANRQEGLMGMLRTQMKLENYNEAVRTATDLLASAALSPEMATEARYLRGKAYLQLKDPDKAMADFQAIANDTRSVYGAEAQFILADTYYRWKSYDRAEAQVKDFMQKGTPHQYWMARAIIVLADTYAARGDAFQAKQYLQSLKANYKGNEADIRQMIDERLRKLN